MTRPPAQTSWDIDSRYLELVEMAPDGIVIHDGETIAFANAAAVRLLGATRREQVVGLAVEKFLDRPYLKAAEAEILDDSGSSEVAPGVRETLHRLDGSDMQVEIRAIAFIDEGRPSAHLVIRDVTERIAAEEAARALDRRMQQAQRMEVVGALAGGMAHEINNMMSVVLGFSEFLVADVGLPVHCINDVREIVKAANRAAAVTGQLLAFSRRTVQHPVSVDLSQAISEVTSVAHRLLGDSWKLETVIQTPPCVWIDPSLLQQVLINLILNARDAMPSGGTLTMSTAPSDISGGIVTADGILIPDGSYAMLVVRDTGIGMNAATAARVFEPFFTTKPVGQGTGLGLAAVHGIVAQSNGYITIESVVGEGTTFTVYLPALREPDDAEHVPPAKFNTPPAFSAVNQPPSRASAHASGDTVLVVDDEPAVRSVATRILERSGFRVIPAADGVHALELMERFGEPQMVLTDLVMPRMGGAELARRLKQRWPALPVVFMSGYSPDELRRHGAVGYEGELIQKPFTAAGLVRCVAAVLAKKDRSASAT